MGGGGGGISSGCSFFSWEEAKEGAKEEVQCSAVQCSHALIAPHVSPQRSQLEEGCKVFV